MVKKTLMKQSEKRSLYIGLRGKMSFADQSGLLVSIRSPLGVGMPLYLRHWSFLCNLN